MLLAGSGRGVARALPLALAAAAQPGAAALRVRAAGGLAAPDESAVLGPCGVEPFSGAFAANSAAMGALLAELEVGVAAALAAGGATAVARHRARGKMLPRERVTSLLDPGSPFLELSQLAGRGLYGARLLLRGWKGPLGIFCSAGQPVTPTLGPEQKAWAVLRGGTPAWSWGGAAERPSPPPRRRRGGPGGRDRDRARPRARPPGRRGRERRDSKGRHVLPGHGEEAPAPAGDCGALPPALPLPR